jgi:catechol 2,3-dioxygenase-like lactoylglutathione lyase family enzyme
VLADADLVAFAASTDLERSEAFYAGVLGLTLVDSTPFAKVFDAHGTQLRVTRVDAVAGAAYTVLGWRVEDIDASIAELGSRGVEFKRFAGMEQDEAGAWTSPSGARIAWFADPDGNTLSLQHNPQAGV